MHLQQHESLALSQHREQLHLRSSYESSGCRTKLHRLQNLALRFTQGVHGPQIWDFAIAESAFGRFD